MNERRNQWMAEKPPFNGDNTQYRPSKGIVLFQFVANGDEGDRFIKVYRSHIIPQERDSNKFNIQRYCPIQSGDGNVECPLCDQGHSDIKERMSIWMYISTILYSTMPKQREGVPPLPQVNYQGQLYFKEDVNDFKIWHASAWRDSPWSDILKLSEVYKGLHNFTAQMDVVGDKLQRRYKLIALPNSAMLLPETYQKAAEACRPIMEILYEEMNSPVQLNPNISQGDTASSNIGTPSQATPTVAPFSAPGVSAPVFEPAATMIEASDNTNIIQVQPEVDAKKPLGSLF